MKKIIFTLLALIIAFAGYASGNTGLGADDNIKDTTKEEQNKQAAMSAIDYNAFSMSVKEALYEDNFDLSLKAVMEKYFPGKDFAYRNYNNIHIKLKNEYVKVIISGNYIKIKPKGHETIERMFYNN